MHRHFLPITCAFLLLAMLPRPAAAGPQEDLAFEVKDAGSQSGSLVVGKLMTLKLGATCWKSQVMGRK